MRTTTRSWLEEAMVGGRLPAIQLPSADGPPARLRRRDRRATVLVRVHSPECPECRSYLGKLDAALRALEAWDGRVLAVVAGSVEDARSLKSQSGVRFKVVADPESAPTSGSAPLDVVVVVADRWGEIYHVARSGAAHELPGPRELDEWLRYLATQCPE